MNNSEQLLTEGEIYTGVVEKILSFGGVVRLNVNNHSFTQLLHISNIIDGFVKDINDVLFVGQEVTVIAIAGKTKPIEISSKQSSFEEYNK